MERVDTSPAGRDTLETLKLRLFSRNEKMISHCSIGILTSTICLAVNELQLVCMLTLTKYNPVVADLQTLPSIQQYGSYVLLDFDYPFTLWFLLLANCAVFLAYLFPITSNKLNSLLSLLITTVSYLLTIPSLFLSSQALQTASSYIPPIPLLLLCLINNAIFHSLHFECSIDRAGHNAMIRQAGSLNRQLVLLGLIGTFPLIKSLLFPTSFAVFIIVLGSAKLLQLKCLMYEFWYHNETLLMVRLVCTSLSVSFCLCYVLVFFLGSLLSMIQNNDVPFLASFFIFFANFLVVYRASIIETTTTQKDLSTAASISNYFMWYLQCFRYITEKKNQLFISSLLKNHCNQCQDVHCCCKKRDRLFDATKETFGSAGLQPYKDHVFIKHFLLKLLVDAVAAMRKSVSLLFLLGVYYIQVMEMVPQVVDLLKRLAKMKERQQLTLSQQFLLFCLKQRCHKCLLSVNGRRGNVDLDEVQRFDRLLQQLRQSINKSIAKHANLWKCMTSNTEQRLLTQNCKEGLRLMFEIEANYQSLTKINSISSELKGLMVLYGRFVAHDKHLLSYILKDLSTNGTRETIRSLEDIKRINPFGTDTLTMVTAESGKIRWASNNAAPLFGYNENEFKCLTIAQLMPKYFAQRHDKYVQQWRESGSSHKLNRSVYLWGKAKQGYCFSIKIYTKMLLLHSSSALGFFSLIEKFDEDEQIVCGEYGEIYASGRRFLQAIGITVSNLSQYQLNIQILVPLTFEYFLEAFLQTYQTSKEELVFEKVSREVKREGYFCRRLLSLLKEIAKEKAQLQCNVSEEGKANSQFLRKYLQMLKHSMQQMTCEVQGEYRSLSFSVFRVKCLRERRPLIVFKLGRVSEGSMQQFYSELENMIKQISRQQKYYSELTKQPSIISSIMSAEPNKNSFFTIMLNPKKVKKMLEKESEELNNIELGRTRRKPMSKSRRQMMLTNRHEINNQRCKFNIWKIKKILLAEGVISRYTYDMLIGKPNMVPNIHSASNAQEEEISKEFVSNEVQEERPAEDSEESINGKQVSNEAQNDQRTFHSGSSSATFIAISSSIEQFKLKLRSLNTPKELFVIHIIVIICWAAHLTVTGVDWFEEKRLVGQGEITLQDNQAVGVIIDAILLGNVNTMVSVSTNCSDPFMTAEQQKLIHLISDRLQPLLVNVPVCLKIPVNISSIQTVLIREYLMDQLHNLLLCKLDPSPANVSEAIVVAMQNLMEDNQFPMLYRMLLLVFTLSLSLLCILLAAVVLPGVYKVRGKIKQIYDLLMKISKADKEKYYEHFKMLNEDTQLKTNSHNMEECIANIEKKAKSNTGAKRQSVQFNNYSALSRVSLFVPEIVARAANNTLSEPATKQETAINAQSQMAQEQSGKSMSRGIYWLIFLVFVLQMAGLCVRFGFLLPALSDLTNQTQIYNKIVSLKMRISLRALQSEQRLAQLQQETQVINDSSSLVAYLYDSYHLPRASEQYRQLLRQFTYGNICTQILPESEGQQIEECTRVKQGTLNRGGLSFLYYVQNKYDQLVRNGSIGNASLMDTLRKGYFYISLAIYQIAQSISQESESSCQNYTQLLQIVTAVVLACSVLFVLGWVWIYVLLSKQASRTNAFLLLIPFDVLAENPYIKLYIRKEFDYKSANY